jgi:AraC-like DNA-binding protein
MENPLELLRSQPLRFEYGFHNAFKSGLGPMHAHPICEIVFHFVGSGSIRLRSGPAFVYDEKSVTLHAPHSPHIQNAAGNGEDICLHIASSSRRFSFKDLFSAIGQGGDEYLHIPAITDPYLTSELIQLSEMHINLTPLEAMQADFRVTALFAGLIAAAQLSGNAHRKGFTGGHAEAAYNYMRSNLQTIKDTDDIARAVGIGTDHLRHVFKQRYNSGIKHWLGNARLEKAKKLLAHSSLPLKAIAVLCGFDNERYLCTVFKKTLGRTPGSYRVRFWNGQGGKAASYGRTDRVQTKNRH